MTADLWIFMDPFSTAQLAVSFKRSRDMVQLYLQKFESRGGRKILAGQSVEHWNWGAVREFEIYELFLP